MNNDKKRQENTRNPSKLNTNTKVPARLAGNKGTLQSNISIEKGQMYQNVTTLTNLYTSGKNASM